MTADRAAAEAAIRALVDLETRAWDARDADLLVTVFHPDMVWPWPPTPRDHDPVDWVLEWGRYDAERWAAGWRGLFETHELVRNDRSIARIAVSDEADGGFAVVDIDTVWRDGDGSEIRWTGRTCKIYTTTPDGWKMIAQTGVLAYPPR